eukprot:jgi/Psemu1/296787/fgenesh1_pm.198_\
MAITVSPDVSGSSVVCCSWQGLLATIHGVLLFLSLWYCKLVFWNAAEACYVDPCYEGPGLEELWKVNKGVTFTGESSGVFCLAHAALGYFLFAGRDSSSSSLLEHAHFVVGVFAGATLCAALLSLNMVCVWGAETNLVINLSKLRESNDVFEESHRHMLVVHSLVATFLRLSTISSFLCFFQLVVLVHLLVTRNAFTRRFRLLAATATGTSADSFETIPLRENIF